MRVWDDLFVFRRLLPAAPSLCVLLAVLLGAGDGHANQVRVDFSGVTTQGGAEDTLPTPSPGERFEGGFAFRTEDVLPLVNEDDYPYEALVGATLELSFGGVAWFSSPTVWVGNDYGPTEDTCLATCDSWLFRTASEEVRFAEIFFEDDTATQVSGPTPFLPTSLEGWTRRQLSITQLVYDPYGRFFYYETQFKGDIDTWQVTVPEPAGLPAAVGLAALASLGVNRRGAARPGRGARLPDRAPPRAPARRRR